MTAGSQLKQTVAVLKGCKETLNIYASQSGKEEAEAVFAAAANELTQVIEELEGRLAVLEYNEPQYKGY